MPIVLTPTAQELDDRMGGAIRRALEPSRFTGKKNSSLFIAAPSGVETTDRACVLHPPRMPYRFGDA